jgi:hypothetical protein
MTWMYAVCLLSVLGSFACAAEEGAPEAPAELVIVAPTECTPLDGAYRVVYAKRSGDCADLPEQLAQFSDRSSTSALNDDCQATVTTSEDDCDREEDAVCPIVGDDHAPIGTANLTTAFTQTSASRIEGMATIELTTTAGTGCSATYALIGSKVE